MRLWLLCLSIFWISVSGQEEDNDDSSESVNTQVPIPDLPQIQLKDKFCLSFKCLSNITDLLEADKVCKLLTWSLLLVVVICHSSNQCCHIWGNFGSKRGKFFAFGEIPHLAKFEDGHFFMY